MKTDKVSFRMANKRSGGYLMAAKVKSTTISVLRALLMFGLCFMIIQPMITRLCTSIMEEKDLYDSTIVLLPRNVTLDNFRIVFNLTDFPNSMLNTLWTSLMMAVFQVFSCTLVAYGFARYDFPLKKFWFGCVVVLIIVPPQTISTSLYGFFSNFPFFGNIRGSVFPYSMMSLTCMGLKNGLYIYMLREYFRGIPKSLEEAAYVDGCSTLHTFTRIMLPDALPIIVSCFMFAFVWQWTDIFYSRNFLSNLSIYSIQLSGIVSRMARYFSNNADQATIVPVGRQQQLISIGVLVCSTPLVILYVFAQRSFVESIAMTGSKE